MPSVEPNRRPEPRTELLCCPDTVAFVAEVASVLVDVEATFRQRSDVVDDLGGTNKPGALAVLTQPRAALHPPRALLYCSTSSEALRHATSDVSRRSIALLSGTCN